MAFISNRDTEPSLLIKNPAKVRCEPFRLCERQRRTVAKARPLEATTEQLLLALLLLLREEKCGELTLRNTIDDKQRATTSHDPRVTTLPRSGM